MSATENKLMQKVMDASVLIGISAGVGYIGRKIIKQQLISDTSSNLINFGKWVVVLSSSLYLINYLEDKKIIPT